MAVVSKHDAIVSMSASSSSSFPFGILLFGIVLFCLLWTISSSQVYRVCLPLFTSAFSLSLSLSDTNEKNPRRSSFCPLLSVA